MKKINKEKLLKSLKTVHIQRYRNTFVDPSQSPDPYYLDSDMIETQLKYKGATVITIYSQLRGSSSEQDLKIDIVTNRKFIKKHNLPYKKTKVFGNDKEFTFENEIQLELGFTFVRKMLFEIIKEVEEKFNCKIKNIKTSRCNGAFMNSNKDLKGDRDCFIKISS